MITIRACTKDDAKRIVEICHVTGDTSYDPYLFGLRWCLYYVWYETKNCFVAVDTETDRVVGYLLSTQDTMKQEEGFERQIVSQIESYWGNLKGKRLLNRIKYHVFIKPRRLKHMEEIYEAYPAHIHINIDPSHQRRGIGHRLMEVYERYAMEHGVRGYHLVVDANNKKGIPFYEKYGLTKVRDIRFFGRVFLVVYGKVFAQ